MTHIWQLQGFSLDDDRLVSSIPLPRVLWPLLEEFTNIPHTAPLDDTNYGEWAIDEAHARALARAAMDVELPKNCEWFVGSTKICEWEGCEKIATDLAEGRRNNPNVGHYCDTHAEIVSDEGNPEYIVSCPNCQCRFGVN